MNIQVKVEASVVAVLALEGRLIAGAGAATLMHAVEAILERGYVNIVLDLRRVEKIDCSGIGQLVNCYHKTGQRGGYLMLAHADPRLRKLLEMFRLDSVLEMYESERDAVASVSGSPSRAPEAPGRTPRNGASRRAFRYGLSSSQTAG
jgi:anti-sigma B factor antagonist